MTNNMPALDFKEIPEAHISSGQQDSFEQFAGEALTAIGFRIVDGPARGPDLGKDLIVLEERNGIGRQTIIRWLVSCKHNAHSGRAVGLSDEPDILERVRAFKCGGFMGVYSTLPSSGLQARLGKLTEYFEVQIFDRTRLEHFLLSSPPGQHVARRFFPHSMSAWLGYQSGPIQIFADEISLSCDWCGKNLLNPPQGIYVVWRIWGRKSIAKIVRINWCCKGDCDRRLSGLAMRDFEGAAMSGWEDIPDFCIPLVYIKYVVAHLNRLRWGDQWSNEAFDKFKTLMLSVYPFVIRPATAEENDSVNWLRRIPEALGGMGF